MNRNANVIPNSGANANASNKQSVGALAARPAQSVRVWNPWSEFDQMRRQMDDLVGGLVGYPAASRLLGSHISPAQNADFDFSPDVYETDSELVFVAPIPGIDTNDLHIEATESTLTVRGERKPFYQQEGATQHRQSWWSARTGAFQAGYTLPLEIDPDRVQAHYRNGVLELHLPKVQPNKPKTVKVNVFGDTTTREQDKQLPQSTTEIPVEENKR